MEPLSCHVHFPCSSRERRRGILRCKSTRTRSFLLHAFLRHYNKEKASGWSSHRFWNPLLVAMFTLLVNCARGEDDNTETKRKLNRCNECDAWRLSRLIHRRKNVWLRFMCEKKKWNLFLIMFTFIHVGKEEEEDYRGENNENVCLLRLPKLLHHPSV